MVHYFTFLDSNGVGIPLVKIRDCTVNVFRADERQPLLADDEDYTPRDAIAIAVVENIAIGNDDKTVEEVIAKYTAPRRNSLAVELLTVLRDTLDLQKFASCRD